MNGYNKLNKIYIIFFFENISRYTREHNNVYENTGFDKFLSVLYR